MSPGRLSSCNRRFGDLHYLSDVYAREADRGKGLTKSLMEWVMAHPALQGAVCLELVRPYLGSIGLVRINVHHPVENQRQPTTSSSLARVLSCN
jgi:hypothetical protein